jgi:hypothetical protein
MNRVNLFNFSYLGGGTQGRLGCGRDWRGGAVFRTSYGDREGQVSRFLSCRFFM